MGKPEKKREVIVSIRKTTAAAPYAQEIPTRPETPISGKRGGTWTTSKKSRYAMDLTDHAVADILWEQQKKLRELKLLFQTGQFRARRRPREKRRRVLYRRS
ncbi:MULTISPECIES: hypothetical protein [Rhodomicrobium]|uniref:hypothetical protein n=1 Tax=Rhodomicrobium TaxID=1068 RepID=UPI000F741F48|nr:MULTISPECIES: hypothetical protein [Rhodomicrobium]